MLDALKNLEYRGGKSGLLFFLCDVISSRGIKISDAKVICSHAPGEHYLSVDSLIKYCIAFGWIKVDEDFITVESAILPFLEEKERLNIALIKSTVKVLFDCGIVESNMFCYDTVQCAYYFKNEMLPLSFSAIRNTLMNQGFFISHKNQQGLRFYISETYESLIAQHCTLQRKQLSLAELKKQLEKNNDAGEHAELFVMNYERKRLGKPLGEKIKRISEVDVTAGYDIVSFDTEFSTCPDRFIEVKAISNSGFYWSKNEYEIAQLKGDTYFLYLVDLGKVTQHDYTPQIIKNPAKIIMESDRWFVEAQTYLIKSL